MKSKLKLLGLHPAWLQLYGDIFDALDEQKVGFLEPDVLANAIDNMLYLLGQPASPTLVSTILQSLIKDMDIDGDSLVSRNDFIHIWLQTAPAQCLKGICTLCPHKRAKHSAKGVAPSHQQYQHHQQQHQPSTGEVKTTSKATTQNIATNTSKHYTTSTNMNINTVANHTSAASTISPTSTTITIEDGDNRHADSTPVSNHNIKHRNDDVDDDSDYNPDHYEEGTSSITQVCLYRSPPEHYRRRAFRIFGIDRDHAFDRAHPELRIR